MPNTIPVGPNPFLVLLDIIQRPNITAAEIDKLRSLANGFAESMDALAGAEVTLEDLADEIDFGEFDYYGDTGTMRKQAKAINQLRFDINSFVPQVITEAVTTKVEETGADHEQSIHQ